MTYYLSTREIHIYSDTQWWADGHVQAARDAVVEHARKFCLQHHEMIADPTPRIVRDAASNLWIFTWTVITATQK